MRTPFGGSLQCRGPRDGSLTPATPQIRHWRRRAMAALRPHGGRIPVPGPAPAGSTPCERSGRVGERVVRVGADRDARGRHDVTVRREGEAEERRAVREEVEPVGTAVVVEPEASVWWSARRRRSRSSRVAPRGRRRTRRSCGSHPRTRGRAACCGSHARAIRSRRATRGRPGPGPGDRPRRRASCRRGRPAGTSQPPRWSDVAAAPAATAPTPVDANSATVSAPLIATFFRCVTLHDACVLLDCVPACLPGLCHHDHRRGL